MAGCVQAASGPAGRDADDTQLADRVAQLLDPARWQRRRREHRPSSPRSPGRSLPMSRGRRTRSIRVSIGMQIGGPDLFTLEADITVDHTIQQRIKLPPVLVPGFGAICMTPTGDGTGSIDCDGGEADSNPTMTQDHYADISDFDCSQGCREDQACFPPTYTFRGRATRGPTRVCARCACSPPSRTRHLPRPGSAPRGHSPASCARPTTTAGPAWLDGRHLRSHRQPGADVQGADQHDHRGHVRRWRRDARHSVQSRCPSPPGSTASSAAPTTSTRTFAAAVRAAFHHADRGRYDSRCGPAAVGNWRSDARPDGHGHPDRRAVRLRAPARR